MTKPDYYLCDICGRQLPEDCRFWVTTDRKADAAGDMDDVGKHLDLCHKHMRAALICRREWVHSNLDMMGQRLVEWVEARKGKR